MPETPETVEINQDIDCEIYAVRGGRLAGSPRPRAYVTLSIDAVTHARLVGLLMANLKGATTVHVLNIQAPLDEPEDDEPTNPPPFNQPAMVGLDGQPVLPHEFAASVDSDDLCDKCGLHRENVIHAESYADDRVSPLAQELIDEAEEMRRTPATPEEAEDQAQAVENLRAKAKV